MFSPFSAGGASVSMGASAAGAFAAGLAELVPAGGEDAARTGGSTQSTVSGWTIRWCAHGASVSTPTPRSSIAARCAYRPRQQR